MSSVNVVHAVRTQDEKNIVHTMLAAAEVSEGLLDAISDDPMTSGERPLTPLLQGHK